MASFPDNSWPARLIRRVGYQTQDTSSGGLIAYWGYAARVVPCTNDEGTCEYFEAVYGGHEHSMLYVGIIWATIGSILLTWAIGRHFWAPPRSSETIRQPISDNENPAAPKSACSRLTSATAATLRYYTLPESMRFAFGRTTRLQVLVLGLLAGYLAIFSFIGIWYKTWTTPVKGYDDLYQKRSWLGPWSDRLGVLAYALTPFSVLLASRESILSQLTGIPYQSFNFLHRWLGWIITVQALVHTIGWTVIESVYYQPQPAVARKWIKQLYMIWGCVAIIILFLLVALATPWGIKLTGYEFFRKSHYILAMLFIGACWGHWEPLKVFMVPGLALWLFDRFARLVRSFLIHYQYLPDGSMGFQTASAAMSLFEDKDGDIVRLDFAYPQSAWKPGQHFFLCFTKASIWQSHPFTPLNLPIEKDGQVKHSYILRAKGGETAKIAKMAAGSHLAQSLTTPVVMQGPYGEDHSLHLTPDANVLCVAGGTGITYVLPILLWLIRETPQPGRQICLVWAVRRPRDVQWVQQELDTISLAKKHGIDIRIYATRQDDVATSPHAPAEPLEDEKRAVLASTDQLCGDDKRTMQEATASLSPSQKSWNQVLPIDHHPQMSTVVPAFLDANASGRTVVFASGPGSLISDLRVEVAKANSGTQIWKGNERYDVQLICDNRLEW